MEESNIKDWVISNRPTIIYGAGNQAKNVYGFLGKYNKKCLGIMTSNNNPNQRHPLLPDSSILPQLSLGGGQTFYTQIS